VEALVRAIHAIAEKPSRRVPRSVEGKTEALASFESAASTDRRAALSQATHGLALERQLEQRRPDRDNQMKRRPNWSRPGRPGWRRQSYELETRTVSGMGWEHPIAA
jgi:hypothetical protein